MAPAVISVAVNRHYVNKLDPAEWQAMANFNDTFETVELSIQQLIDEIRQGHAFTAAHRQQRHPRSNGRPGRFRCAQNFISAQHLALDFDDSSLAEVLHQPFVATYAAFLYTTPSHKPAAPRSRAVFILDQPVTDSQRYGALAAALTHKFDSQADASCKDPARVFYGSAECDVRWLGKVLPTTVMALMLHDHQAARAQRPCRAVAASRTGDLPSATDLEEVRDALRHIPRYLDYKDWLSVLMAVHSVWPDETGVALVEEWSPGYEGEVDYRFSTFTTEREEKYGLGTVYWLAEQHGWQRSRKRRAISVAAGPEQIRTAMPLDEAARGIRARVRRVLHQETDPGSTLIVTAPPGVGKTTAIIEEMKALPASVSGKIWFLGPRHDLYEPEHKAAGLELMQGRNRDNCRYANIAEQLSRKKYPVDALLCSRCELERHCAYYRQFSGPGHRYAMLPVLHTSYPQDAAAIVMDELTPGYLLEESVVTFNDLKCVVGDPAASPFVRPVVEVLRDVLHERIGQVRAQRSERSQPSAAVKGPRVDTGLALRGAPLLDTLEARAPGTLADLVDKAWSVLSKQACLDALTTEAAEALPTGSLHILMDALDDELSWRNEGRQGGVVTLDPYRKVYRITRRRQGPDWLRDMRLIVLNATADPDTLLDLLGRDRATAEIFSPHVELPWEVEVIQLTDAMYGKTTLVASSTSRRSEREQQRETLGHALDRVSAELEPSLSTGLITFKDIEEEAGKALGIAPDFRGHFGAVQGRNDFRRLEQLVILGTFSPPTDAVVEQACAIHAGREPLNLLKNPRRTPYQGYRDAQGHGLAFDVLAFDDPRLQTLYHEQREGALLQAAHRLRLHRPSGRERVRLILATALPIADLPPTSIVRDHTATKRSTRTYIRLQDALAALVDEQGHATRAEVGRRAGVDKSTVSRHWTRLLADAGLVAEARLLPSGKTIQEVEVAARPAGNQGAPGGIPEDGGAEPL